MTEYKYKDRFLIIIIGEVIANFHLWQAKREQTWLVCWCIIWD